MTRSFTLIAALAACHHATPATTKLDAALVHSAIGGYGVQPPGEDKGVLYAFVRVHAARTTHAAIAGVAVKRAGATCGKPTTTPTTKIADATYALTLDALAQGAQYTGALAAGTTFLRVQVELDHTCGGDGEPTVELTFDDGTVIAQVLAERLPS